MVLIAISLLALAASFYQSSAADNKPDAIDSSTHIPIGAVGGIVVAAWYVGRRLVSWETAMKQAATVGEKYASLESKLDHLATLMETRPCMKGGACFEHKKTETEPLTRGAENAQ